MQVLETTRLNLATNIRRRRKELGFTQVVAAETCGISTQSMHKAEDPKDKTGIELDTLDKIAKGLGVDLPALLGPSNISCAPIQGAEILAKLEKLLATIRQNPEALDALMAVVSGFEAASDEPKARARGKASG